MNSPILVDVDGRGFELTGPENGVLFDIVGRGIKSRVAWPAHGSTNAWLVLDRNGNGFIDDVTEMFGNRTDQPAPPPGVKRNGFLALAVFDSAASGGNGDGIIDRSDRVFDNLRLWQDLNHNGVSEPNELKRLPELGIAGIDLRYRDASRVDAFGNRFCLPVEGRRFPSIRCCSLVLGRGASHTPSRLCTGGLTAGS